MANVKATIHNQLYKTVIQGTSHTFLSDEPVEDGGQNLGPTPGEYLASALAACTTITIKMYAARKEWPLDEVEVNVAVDYKTEPGITRFKKEVLLKGNLTDEQKNRLYMIAGRCPINKALQQQIIME